MTKVSRKDLLAEINALSVDNLAWSHRIRDLVVEFENDNISFDELQDLIKDYRRELQNDQSISDIQVRAKTEVCLEMLFALAKAVS